MTLTRPEVSVIICAYTLERWNDLMEAVNSVQRQTFSSYEVIIVIDHNPELFKKASTAIIGATVVENNGQKGLSGARNTALAAASGRLMAFLDDDAIAPPDWLSVVCFWCDQPGVLGAGCKIEPLWLAPRPAWFPDEFGWVLGYSYLGLPKRAARVRNLNGANMIFHREVFDEIGGFRTEIGRINKNPLGCEETELCIRALQKWPESIFFFDPDISIQHKIPASRTKWAYFRARCYSEGLSKALVTKFVGAKDGLGSERSYTLRILPKGVMAGFNHAIFHRDRFGLARSGAILMGLFFTTVGYLVGSITNQIGRIKYALGQKSSILKTRL